MQFTRKQAIILVLLIVVVTFGTRFFDKKQHDTPPVTSEVEEPVVEVTEQPANRKEVVGISVQSRPIEMYYFGSGEHHLLFVGGIHGGYEWNSVLLAYELIDYLEANPDATPEGVSIAIIPSINPDGVYEVVGKEGRFTLADVPLEKNTNGTGRFNADNVDLNRNFDCKWKPESMWRSTPVSAGTAPFSEPEAQALRNVVATYSPDAAIFFHSQSNAVYASECQNGILPETQTIMSVYANAAGYKTVDSFDAYEVTGDAEGWLASINVPAITVELSSHETTDWEKNKAGITALLSYYSVAK